MDDIRLYDFVLKLNTYLNQINNLAEKLTGEEIKLQSSVLAARMILPNDLFVNIFEPMLPVLEKRMDILKQMQESDDELIKSITQFYSDIKGVTQ
jgi:hypothetical protein